MKKLLLLLLFTFLVTADIQAQRKQRKVLLQQIGALKVYIDAAQKGYSIAKKGLNTIGNLKRGEFTLHTDYLNSLKKVNPKIKKYSRVAEIIDLQLKIVKNCNSTYRNLEVGDLFHGSEVAYIKRVFGQLMNDCDANLEELITVTTDGELEMKDDERMERIDRLYNMMMDNYSFCQSFNNQVNMLCLSRARENRETQSSKEVYGILKERL
ncbi:hypothetical protein [Flavobacterium seoulense]|uniref:TerB family tellurite resistance protein n=1 Tax=Flavobacterium seoulense TaxID=1492738 RepID=A0A066WKY0_9FLAO|nr:hypothetical protein [Flavobacterium seoulense]KDN54672.1 hypothetical protein FEM21_21860 [Flavobacterium seoulense]